MQFGEFINVSVHLDRAGLVWYPEIGDEVALRQALTQTSILVDPQGLTPRELRASFLWLPTVEQLVQQLEAREAFIYHAGINAQLAYETVVKCPVGVIETRAATLRIAFGKALQELLVSSTKSSVH